MHGKEGFYQEGVTEGCVQHQKAEKMRMDEVWGQIRGERRRTRVMLKLN